MSSRRRCLSFWNIICRKASQEEESHQLPLHGGALPQFLMLPSAFHCTRRITAWPSSTRPLAHFTPHMDPDAKRPVERAIRTKLTRMLKPDHVEVHNESHMHAVPPGSESHFRVLVVSSQFEGLPLIQRHRLVNEALKEELSSCVHALAIQAKTPEQWGKDPSLGKSPSCMGGVEGRPHSGGETEGWTGVKLNPCRYLNINSKQTVAP